MISFQKVYLILKALIQMCMANTHHGLIIYNNRKLDIFVAD